MRCSNDWSIFCFDSLHPGESSADRSSAVEKGATSRAPLRAVSRPHGLPRRRRQDYNGSDSRERIAQIPFDWSMKKAAEQENFDRKRSWEVRGRKHQSRV